MTTKRQTKDKEPLAQKAALRVRIRDLAIGAAGCSLGPDDEEPLSLEVASRLIPVLMEEFGNEKNQHLFKPHNLDEYEYVDKITDFYWRNGVRA